jgi:hypothetical protein
MLTIIGNDLLPITNSNRSNPNGQPHHPQVRRPEIEALSDHRRSPPWRDLFLSPKRKAEPKKIIAGTDLQFSESFEIEGRAMFVHTSKLGLEGVVSKARQCVRERPWE